MSSERKLNTATGRAADTGKGHKNIRRGDREQNPIEISQKLWKDLFRYSIPCALRS